MHVDDRQQGIHLVGLGSDIDVGIAPGPDCLCWQTAPSPLPTTTPMPLSRRDFLKLAAASIVAAPLPCLSGEELPRALWLQRDKEWGLIDIESSEGYRQACWLLRDTQAGQTASASMRLLQTAAWMQAFFAAYQMHRPFDAVKTQKEIET